MRTFSEVRSGTTLGTITSLMSGRAEAALASSELKDQNRGTRKVRGEKKTNREGGGSRKKERQPQEAASPPHNGKAGGRRQEHTFEVLLEAKHVLRLVTQVKLL